MDQGTVTLLLQIVAGLLIIFMLVAAYFNTRTWRFLHVFMCLLVFAAACTYTVFAAYVMKTNHNWRALHEQRSAAVDQEKAKGERLKEGPLSSETIALDNVRTVHRELDRVIQSERGRVWRSCTVTASTPTSVELDLVGPKPVGVPDENIIPFGFDKAKADAKKLVVQAFTEEKVELVTLYPKLLEGVGGTDALLPDVYVGEFVVDDLTPSTIAATPEGGAEQLKMHLLLKPRLPFDARQLEALTDRSKTWTLYESMPVDMHEVFRDLNGTDEGQRRFTELFDAKRFPKGVAADKIAAIKQQYARDGQAATADDPPARKWVKVQLSEAMEFDVDAEAQQLLSDRFFDSTGRALAPFLRLTPAGAEKGLEKAKFAKNDTLLLQADDAEKLIAAGKAKKVEIELAPDKKVDALYVRELRDYGQLFHKIVARGREADDFMAKVSVDTARIKKAADDVAKQIKARELEKTKLTEDKQNVDRDHAAVKTYLAELSQQRTDLLGQCNTAFKSNQALAAELANVQKRLADQINARTGGPAPAASPAAPSVPSPPAAN